MPTLIRCLSVLSALLALLAAPAASQTTWFVGPNPSPPGTGTVGDPYTSIQYAIDQPTTLFGDRIEVAPGTYFETVDFTFKDLALVATGPGPTVIDAGGAGRVVTVAGGQGEGSHIEGFTLTGGSVPAGSSGGGILVQNASDFDVRSCTVVGCSASDGGGIAYVMSDGVIEDCVISGNQALGVLGFDIDGRGGGFYGFQGFLTVENCTIESNMAYGDGGGLWIDSLGFTVDGCTVRQNLAISSPAEGGGLYLLGSGTVDACVVAENEAFGTNSLGGGIRSLASGVIRNCTIESNVAGDANGNFFGEGGGLAGGGAVEDTLFRQNFANGNGGGAAFAGPFLRCTFEANGAQFGGGAYSSATFDECRFTQNSGFGTGSQDFGAGVYDCTLFDCELDQNFVAGQGGGAHSSTLTRCLIRDNTATATFLQAGSGGGAFACTLVDCEVRGNEVQPFSDPSELAIGGGLSGGSATGCVIWGNQALSDGGPGMGGGTFQTDLTRCVVYDNFAALGAGVYGGDLEHCTIYDNAGEGVRQASSLHNSIVRAHPVQLVGTSATWCNVQGGAPGVGNIDAPEIFWMPDPGPMGLGRDFHFASAFSPGIDSGDPTSPLDPDGSIADLGAYPYDPSYLPLPTTYCTAKTSTTGGCSGQIGFSGAPTLTGPDDFHLTASSVLGKKPGLVFWGYGSATIPFLGGTLCVLPPLRRTPVQLSSGSVTACDGAYDHAFTQAEMASVGLTAGTEVYCQYRFRDPGDPFGIALTNALFFSVLP